MNDLRQAAEMALEALEDIFGKEKKDVGAINALRQALAHEALDRMVAESQRLGLYDDGPAVKTYAGGKPNYCTPEHELDLEAPLTVNGVPLYPKKEWVGLSVNEARKFYEKYTNREELIYAMDKFLEEKNA